MHGQSGFQHDFVYASVVMFSAEELAFCLKGPASGYILYNLCHWLFGSAAALSPSVELSRSVSLPGQRGPSVRFYWTHPTQGHTALKPS